MLKSSVQPGLAGGRAGMLQWLCEEQGCPLHISTEGTSLNIPNYFSCSFFSLSFPGVWRRQRSERRAAHSALLTIYSVKHKPQSVYWHCAGVDVDNSVVRTSVTVLLSIVARTLLENGPDVGNKHCDIQTFLVGQQMFLSRVTCSRAHRQIAQGFEPTTFRLLAQRS